MTFDQEKFNQTFKKANLNVPRKIRKRNGKYENFDPTKIYRAVELCYSELGRDVHPVSPQELTEQVSTALVTSFKSAQRTVEVIQDLIELRLNMASDFEAARAFIVYREDHARRRIAEIPEEVKKAFAKDSDFLRTPGQQFVFYDKYSRWNNDLNRRETWVETVQRTVDHLRWEVEEHLKTTDAEGLDDSIFDQIHEGILKTNVMPSMRLLAMAGPAVRRNSLSLYNCSYLPVRDIQAFVEALLISMNGCGVGFSVERENVERFPRIRRQRKNIERPIHVIADTTEGWAEALRLGLETWWDGRDIEFDFTLIRPAGSVLFTKGGRSSGPEPLRAMLNKLREIILNRQGSFLRTVDAHYMMCAVGDAAVQGGTRRTAMISLFSPDDYEMMTIKSGPVIDPLLWNANNSIVWGEDITDLEIVETMTTMIKNKSGEPGIFSRRNAQATKPRRRAKAEFGTNPCGEIILRPYGLCNLSQAVCKYGDDEVILSEKVRLATIIGLIQSLSTRFPGLREDWVKNCIDERLLGVDLTAQHTCELTRPGAPDAEGLRDRLVKLAYETAEEYSRKLGINMPASITTNKPAGNSSELLNVESGIHAAHAPYYIRRYTVGVTSPLFKVLRESGVPMEPRVGTTPENATSWIMSIPKKSSPGVLTKREMSAIDQLEFWKLNKIHWTEHNPSVTISYRMDEIVEMIAWVARNKDVVGGVSFLPVDDHVYAQAPYEEIDEATYEKMVAEFPAIAWETVYSFEMDDMTTAAQEQACFAGSCEV